MPLSIILNLREKFVLIIIKSIIDLELLLVVTFSHRCADSLSQESGISLSCSLAPFDDNIEHVSRPGNGIFSGKQNLGLQISRAPGGNA
ncbi:hypothetical protein D9M71_734270 [compost metagenome]